MNALSRTLSHVQTLLVWRWWRWLIERWKGRDSTHCLAIESDRNRIGRVLGRWQRESQRADALTQTIGNFIGRRCPGVHHFSVAEDIAHHRIYSCVRLRTTSRTFRKYCGDRLVHPLPIQLLLVLASERSGADNQGTVVDLLIGTTQVPRLAESHSTRKEAEQKQQGFDH